MTEQVDLPWLIEARKFIGEKEIKGKQHNPLILQWWKDIKRGGIKDDETPWCFTGETEIMTENGWVRFDKLESINQVYQVNDDGKLSLTQYEPIVKDYIGDVFDINHRSVKLTCDVGHRWWGAWGKRKYFTFDTLENIPADHLNIPASESAEIGYPITDDELILLAAFISDGKYKWDNGKNETTDPWSIEFEVSKMRKIKALLSLSPDHVYTHGKVYGPLTKVPLTVFRFLFPEFFKEVFAEYKILKQEFINSLSKAQASLFLKAYSIFDGNGDDFNISIYTSDEKILDILIQIAVMAGLHPSVQTRGIVGLGKKEAFVLKFCPYKEFRSISKKHITRRAFNGKMFCVRVPEGRIVVRGVNKTPVVTGNCAAFAGAMLERVGIRSTRFEGAKSYLEWGNPIGNAVYGCIVVFTREGGGHVGFVVGKTKEGELLVLGGNQSDAVNVRTFTPARVSGYRWPKGIPVTTQPMPISTAERSNSEA